MDLGIFLMYCFGNVSETKEPQTTFPPCGLAACERPPIEETDMALKKAVESTSRSNKVRFVLVEADISDGNLTELTHAISNALKPSVAPIRPALRPSSSPTAAGEVVEATVDDLETGTHPEVLETEQAEAEQEGGSRPGKSRSKPALPAYLPDLDVKGNGTTFKQYAEELAPKSQMKRYLLAALWLRDHGNSPTIDIDKVYTLFRTAGWPVGIKDWDANFRYAVKRDLMQRKEPGEYFITPVGEDALRQGGD
jgi:hypothetical protein